MTNIEFLTTFFGWCTVINFGLLTFSTIALVLMQGSVKKIHGKIFNMKEEELAGRYFNYLANYKILVIVLNLVPYIALKIMG